MEVVPIGAFEFLLALVEVLVLIEFRSLEGVKREAEGVVVYIKNPQSPLSTLVHPGKNNDYA
ncbi:MAG: hypothetical protein MJA30_00440 [Cytophagales bacterium]|nr:hypothetical protein [Cytophagales bacterium]